MGLDMYAWAVKPENVVSDEQFISADDNRPTEFFYWRKHHDLHGWMGRLYAERGGEKEFNCVPVRLFEEDLDALELAVKSRMLPETTGFFFGNNPPDDDSLEDDLDFIKKARHHIAEGYAVYYDSWW